MPCTFSHPAAILPLKRFCPRYLDFTALVMGSLSPDFGYYAHQFNVAMLAHAIPGSFTICLPSGLLAWALFKFLRKPICFILPAPHRETLLPLCETVTPLTGWRFPVIAFSILLGAWTHIFWDAFTHANGWFVHRISWLHTPLFVTGHMTLQVCYFLQQLSTFTGAAILIFVYRSWLRDHSPGRKSRPSDECWRYLLWLAIVITALSVSLPMAFKVSRLFHGGYPALTVFVTRTGIYSVAIGVPLVVVSAIAIALCRHLRASV